MQLAELREYAARRGWQIVEEFTHQGVSGCKESRPALNRLMSDACRRRFDAVLVWKIDRFGRSLKHLVSQGSTGPGRYSKRLAPRRPLLDRERD
jgi:DNA invertase Pin-like site-specific DNA recombinase